MKLNQPILSLLTMASMVITPMAYGANIVDGANTKAVGHVVWHTQVDIDPQSLINKTVPDNASSLFFIRRYDNDTDQLSANIAVNNRFQVSLHPGNYTQVYSCTGTNRLSAAPTGLKTNDLLLASHAYELEGGKNYFFYIDVDEQGRFEIQQITEDSALDVLQNKRYQSHQVTRVVPNCPAPVAPATPVAPPPTVVIETPTVVVEPVVVEPIVATPSPAPVLQEKVSIELEILFENNKTIIRPQYFHEVGAVADFMKEYSNTTAVIEGHTDSTASDSYNQALSKRRADAVKQMLVMQYGIDPERVTTMGYGESQPRASNDTAEGREQNRRVIAVIDER